MLSSHSPNATFICINHVHNGQIYDKGLFLKNGSSILMQCEDENAWEIHSLVHVVEIKITIFRRIL